MDSSWALMLLADGRLPAGGHAHSAGMESAVADGRVRDLDTLEAWLRGRLRTAGLTDASLAAATVLRICAQKGGPGDPPSAHKYEGVLAGLDAEADARIVPPPLREASRRLGRQLLRVAGRCWPSPVLAVASGVAGGLHQSVAFGVVGIAADLSAGEIARLVVHHTIATPAQAAVRLLGLDPFAVAALQASLAPDAESVAADAMVAAAGDLRDLPALSGPIVDIAAVEHAGWDLRLFAS